MAGEDAVVLMTDVFSSDEDDLQQQEEVTHVLRPIVCFDLSQWL